jgi:hypothetical protein
MPGDRSWDFLSRHFMEQSQGLAYADVPQYKFAMTTNEFCESSGLAPRELRRWIETGLLEA